MSIGENGLLSILVNGASVSKSILSIGIELIILLPEFEFNIS